MEDHSKFLSHATAGWPRVIGITGEGVEGVEPRDQQIVFFVRIESRIESAVRFVFESNLRINSAVYHASRNTA